MSGGTNALIEGNLIRGGDGANSGTGKKGAQLDGIHVDNNDGAQIADNTIRGGNGKFGFGNKGGSGAGAHGIYVTDSQSVSVRNNNILAGSNNGIINPRKGGQGADLDGIRAVNNAGTNSLKNGISLVGNTINGSDSVYGAGGAGIFVQNSGHRIGGNPAEVKSNNVSHVGNNGIDIRNTSRIHITDNHVDNTFGIGIRLNPSHGALIDGNDVSSTTGDGIAVISSNDVSVSNNRLHTIGGHGISGDNSNDLSIASNTIGTGGVFNYGAALDGIHIAGGKNATIDGNTIQGGSLRYGAGNDGIHVDGNREAVISNNTVQAGSLLSVGALGHGIYVNNSGAQEGFFALFRNGAQVTGNQILNNGLSLGAGKDGIHVKNSAGGLLGTSALISGNTVRASGNDGIFSTDTIGLRVNGNTVSLSNGDGIDIRNTALASVTDNDVSLSSGHGLSLNNASLSIISSNTVSSSGGDGIRTEQSSGLWLSHNLVRLSSGDGISVNGGDGISLYRNRIALSGGDGVNIWGANDVLLKKNSAILSGGDGFDIGWSANVLAWGNKALLSGENGFEITNSCDINLGLNLIGLSGDNGIFASNVHGLDIVGNALWGGRGNGVTLFNTPYALIAGNSIVGFENGVSAFFSKGVNILYNHISHVWNDGVQGYFTDGIRVIGNFIHNYGDDGVQIAYSHGLGFFKPVLIAGNTIVGNLPSPAPEDEDGGDEKFLARVYDEVRGGGNTGIRLGDNEELFSGKGHRGFYNVEGDFSGVQGALIINNDILNNDVGLDARSFNNGYINVNSNRFFDNQIGMWIGSGLIDLRGTRNTLIDEDSGDVIPVGNIFHGGDTAMIFERAQKTYYPGYEQQVQALCVGEGCDGGGSITSFAFLKLAGDTLGTTVFEEQKNYYVDLRNGAFFDPGAPTIIDGTQALWDGVWGGLMSASQLKAIESKLNDFDDDVSLGQIFAGWFLSLNDNQILRKIFNYRYGSGRASVIVKGLPFTGFLPGFSLADLANIEPAAGGEGGGEDQPPVNGHCWGALGNGGGAFEIGLDSDPSNLLADIAACYK